MSLELFLSCVSGGLLFILLCTAYALMNASDKIEDLELDIRRLKMTNRQVPASRYNVRVDHKCIEFAGPSILGRYIFDSVQKPCAVIMCGSMVIEYIREDDPLFEDKFTKAIAMAENRKTTMEAALING